MRRKKIVGIILSMILVFANITSVLADTSPDGKWDYVVSDGKITNLKPVNRDTVSGKVVIPSTIDGKEVISIADSAFDGCSNLTSLEIPDSVISIGRSAFASCFYLTDLKLGSKLATIGDIAFYSTALTKVEIPDKVISIGNNSFGNCSSLTLASFYNKDTIIDAAAFDNSINTKIIGFRNSTAFKFAETNGRSFEQLIPKKELDTSVGVEATATIIDVTVTEDLIVSFDPNKVEQNDIVKELVIKNNSTAPILVTSKGLNPDTTGYFNLVSPEKYQDWTVLTKEMSKDLAVVLTLKDNWKDIPAGFGVYKTGPDGGSLKGTINPNNSASVTCEIKHGTSFTEWSTSSFKIDWVIGLE